MALVKKFSVVAGSTLISRIFGFTREVLMAASIGTGPVADAFNAAFRFPNSFRRLLGEGALNSAFVPLFSKKIAQEGKIEATAFATKVFSALTTILLLLTFFIEVLLPVLIRYVIAPGFHADPAKFNACLHFSHIMFPYLSCMSLAALIGGILNALQRYFVAAIAPVLLNIFLITILVYCWWTRANTWQIGSMLSFGVLAAGIAQALLVWFAMRAQGVFITFAKPHFTPELRHLLKIALPAALTGGVTQINLLVNTSIASSQAGAISALAYADRLYQLPLGVVGVAIGTVLLPEMARILQANPKAPTTQIQNTAIQFSLFLTLPASTAFLIIAVPIVRLLYEHGHFSVHSTIIVAQLLQIYGIGLPAFILIKTFLPNFFARGDTKTPLYFSLVSVIINITLALLLFPCLHARGIALAEICSAWVNTALLFFTLVKRNYLALEFRQLKDVACLCFSSCLMGFVLSYGVSYFQENLSPHAPLVKLLSTTMGLILAAGALYCLCSFLLCPAAFSQIKTKQPRNPL